MAELLRHNIKIALPMSEHLPFDLVAISPNGQLKKVSVKYRSSCNGKIEVLLKSNWSNSKGGHSRRLERSEVDAHAIYCPDTGTCYFLRDDQIKTGMITLRLSQAKAVGNKEIRYASNFINPFVMFD